MNDGSNMNILMESEPTGQPTDEILINHVLEISSGLEGAFKSFMSCPTDWFLDMLKPVIFGHIDSPNWAMIGYAASTIATIGPFWANPKCKISIGPFLFEEIWWKSRVLIG